MSLRIATQHVTLPNVYVTTKKRVLKKISFVRTNATAVAKGD